MAKQYQVLARKWRPQQFDEVVGQEHIATTLQHAIQKNRLAHAYLFVGPRGIGKTSIARIFAKALNCVKGPTVTPCDECDNCREIMAGNSLDVLEIDGASNRGIDEIRDLRETVRYAPARGRFKIYLIDEVHMLTKEAFNALLKTLEEPPAHVKFFFATTEPQKVLPTILSRCQRFDLRRIPANLIVKRLQEIAKAEKVAVEPAALAAIARGAEGGLRDAESAFDQLIAFCGDSISEADVLGVFGLVAHDRLAALTDAVIDGQTNAALALLRELDEDGKDLQRLLTDLLEHFRNLLVLSLAGGAADALELADTDLALVQAQAQRVDGDAVLRIIDALAAAENRLRYALSKRIFFEVALVKAIKAREQASLEEVLKKLNDLKNGLPADAAPATSPARTPAPARASASAPVPAPAPVAAPRRAVASAPQPSAASLDEAWARAVEHLGKVVPMARSYFVGARPVELRGDVLVIGFDAEFAEHRELADTARNRELLQHKLRETLQLEVGLKFDVVEGLTSPEPATEPATAAAAAPASAPAPARPATGPGRKGADEFTNDPLIKKALEIFKATIVEVKQ